MPELPTLFTEHWKEVALDKDIIELDPDWQGYVLLEVRGILHIITARANGKLIGYYFALVMPNLHYKAVKMSWSDIFFILPEYRRGLTGLKLFTETEKMLKSLGVRKSYVMTKVHLPITIIMKRMAYRFIERIYAKIL